VVQVAKVSSKVLGGEKTGTIVKYTEMSSEDDESLFVDNEVSSGAMDEDTE